MDNVLTQAYLLRRYGPTMTVAEVAEALKTSRQSLYNAISRGTFPIPSTQPAPRRRRYFDPGDVAQYLKQRHKA